MQTSFAGGGKPSSRYATLIVKGKKTLDRVPALIRKQVEEILKDLEVEVE